MSSDLRGSTSSQLLAPRPPTPYRPLPLVPVVRRVVRRVGRTQPVPTALAVVALFVLSGLGVPAAGATFRSLPRAEGTPFAAAVAPAANTSNLSVSIFTYDPSGTDTAPAEFVPFYANISGGIAPYWENWNIQPGNQDSQCWSDICNEIDANFTTAGWYHISLYVNDSAAGMTAIVSLPYQVLGANSSLLTANISVSPILGSAPLSVDASAQITGGRAPYNYTWTLDNGSLTVGSWNGSTRTGITGVTTAVINVSGSYVLTFAATDANGTGVLRAEDILVYPPPNITASLTANVTSGAAPLAVNFSSSVTNGTNISVAPTSYWILAFGADNRTAGNQSTEVSGDSGQFTYDTPGSYIAVAEIPYQFVYDNFTVATWAEAWLTISVTNGSGNGSGGSGGGGAPKAPALTVAGHLLTATGTSEVMATFEIEVAGGTLPYSIQVAFGDGSFGSAVPGTPFGHTYAHPGVYHPTVTVRDGAGIVQLFALPPITVVGAPAAPLHLGGLTGLAVYGAAAAVLLLTSATFLLVRRQSRDRARAQAEGEALVRALQESGPKP